METRPAISLLVIDDEQIVLDSVKKQLRDENYLIHAVLTVEEALQVVDREKIDIVLTDLMMPHTDGLELMGMLKGRFPDMPVIVMTGYATVSTALQATRLGASGYVAKPFTKAELKEVVQRAVHLVTGSRDGDSTD
jgi:DNA-binding NtrC family response regulator